jgi:hypothetical protein
MTHSVIIAFLPGSSAGGRFEDALLPWNEPALPNIPQPSRWQRSLITQQIAERPKNEKQLRLF